MSLLTEEKLREVLLSLCSQITEAGIQGNIKIAGGAALFVGEEEWTEIIQSDGFSIQIASSKMLLAMKLKANRGRRDNEDIEYLISELELDSEEQVQEIYEYFYSQEVLSETALIRVREYLGRSSGSI